MEIKHKELSVKQNIVPLSLVNKIVKLQKMKNMDDIKNSIDEINKDFNNYSFPFPILRKSILNFYEVFNHLTNQKNEKYLELSNFLILNFAEENLLELVKSLLQAKFRNIFINYKIFANLSTNEELISFIIIFLTKNNEKIKEYLIENLNIKEVCEEIQLLNFENPNALKLIDEIYYNYKIENKNSMDIKQIIKEAKNVCNVPLSKIFHCSKCYELGIIDINNEKIFNIKCPKGHEDFILDQKTINDKNNTNYNCSHCNNIISFFYENFKCVSCNSIVCWKCKESHLNNCLSIYYIKLYEVGYMCTIHNKYFSDFCFLCKKNLCKICKNTHIHKVNELPKVDNITITEALSGNIKTNNSIENKLLLLYVQNSLNNLFNGFINIILNKIYHQEYNNSINKEDYLFKVFFNKEFKEYYSYLLNEISKGKLIYYNSLKLIEKQYDEKSQDSVYFYDNYSLFKREKEIDDYIKDSIMYLDQIENIHSFNYVNNKINNIKIKNHQLKINIIEIKTELFKYSNKNRVYMNNLHSILSRFFVDKIIKLLSKKYPKLFKKVNISLNILLDLISSNKNIVDKSFFRNEAITLLNNILNDFTKLNDNPNNKENNIQLFNLLKNSSQLEAEDDFSINNKIINKKEFNFLLETLFYIKGEGNTISHANFDKNENIKVMDIINNDFKFHITKLINELNNQNKISENSEDKNKIFEKITINEDENEYYEFKEQFSQLDELSKKYNLFQFLKDLKNDLKEKIDNKIDSIMLQLINEFSELKTKDNFNIEEIISLIFDGNDEIIYSNNKVNFRGVAKVVIEDIRKKLLNSDLVDYFFQENNNINKCLKTLYLLREHIIDFYKLKLIKHSNLGKIIKQNSEINNKNRMGIIIEIKALLKQINYDNIDCLRNEIEAEIYFLSLAKIYEEEINDLNNTIEEYENEIIKNMIYGEFENILKEIFLKTQKEYKEKGVEIIPDDIMKSLDENALTRIKKISISEMKQLLKCLIDENEIFTLDDKNIKIDSELYYQQNIEHFL